MWYLISGGGGLLLGLGMLIWALAERSHRHSAERSADKAVSKQKTLQGALDEAAKRVEEVIREAARRETEIMRLRSRLDEAYQRLQDCRDPKAVAEWLAKETKPETI